MIISTSLPSISQLGLCFGSWIHICYAFVSVIMMRVVVS